MILIEVRPSGDRLVVTASARGLGAASRVAKPGPENLGCAVADLYDSFAAADPVESVPDPKRRRAA